MWQANYTIFSVLMENPIGRENENSNFHNFYLTDWAEFYILKSEIPLIYLWHFNAEITQAYTQL